MEGLNHLASFKWLCTWLEFWVYIHSFCLSQKFGVAVSCWDHVCRTIPELIHHVRLSLFNCAVIWLFKWTHIIWGLLEGLVKQRLKVRTNANIDNVRTFSSPTWKELYYFTVFKHSSKQRLVATGIQRILILNYIRYQLNLCICYQLIYWKFF